MRLINNEYLNKVGAKIKAERERQGIYLRDLGKMCDMDYSNICRIETGQSNVLLLTLKKIADALQVDVKEFL